jgi:hypothetical protein
MRKINFFASVVAMLVLIGVGTLLDAGTRTSTTALAGSAVDPLAAMMGAKGLPISHHDDYSLVFN